jgi:GNAT superfamily N-acetyltransferase
MRYIKDCGPDRLEDILDFANMVFSMEYNGIDFSLYFPKAYSDKRQGITTHHLLLDDKSDKLRALIDTYPLSLRLEDRSISAEYIGTVCVHPAYRNRGLFSELMDRVEREAIDKGTDLLILDGERHRYAGFGYEKAGMKYSFDIEYKSALNEASGFMPYTFEEIDEESLLLDKIYELYAKRNVTARDREDFYVSLLSMKSSTFGVIEKGRIVGYVNLSEDEKNINEFELENVDDIPKLMLDIMDGFGIQKLGVTVGADEVDKIRNLEKVSSYYNVSLSHQVKILNYEKVISFLFKWKMKYRELSDGEYIFGIRKDEGVCNYLISIKAGEVSVKETLDKAVDVFEEREFVRIFTTGYYYIDNTNYALAGWLPLPFFLPEGDSF